MSGGAFPYDITNLLGGAVRVLFGYVVAPSGGGTAAAIPTGPKDVFAQVNPYASTATWHDFGATSDNFSYSRGLAVEGWEIQQATGNVIDQVTDTNRSITVPMAELAPQALQIIEESAAITAQAAGVGVSAYDKVAFGSIDELTRYRIAFVSRRSKASGVVQEPGGAQRGRFVVGVGYQCSISADDVSIEQGKGSLASASVTFNFFPDTTQPSGQEFGAWYFEKAGTIT
jgi:hypothetical protein